MSSKWNRPMRRFQSVRLVCRHCGEAVRSTDLGWEHVQRMKVRDPQWHRAEP